VSNNSTTINAYNADLEEFDFVAFMISSSNAGLPSGRVSIVMLSASGGAGLRDVGRLAHPARGAL
jgi:hypothetical protein